MGMNICGFARRGCGSQAIRCVLDIEWPICARLVSEFGVNAPMSEIWNPQRFVFGISARHAY